MWDPEQYLTFQDHRERAAHELLVRVGATSARRVVDLGCGAGNLTSVLARRWPAAVVEATDISEEMVRTARARGVDARLQDVRDWLPRSDTDVVMCNAVLQWVPEHVELLRDWLSALPAGAWFAFQVPGNFESPAYSAILELAGEPEWRSAATGLLGPHSVLSPTEYADLIADLGLAADVWESTYVHRLEGVDPVLEWVTGTTLRPLRAALDDTEWQRFRAALAPRLRSEYAARSDGTTWFPFRRVFAVAHR